MNEKTANPAKTRVQSCRREKVLCTRNCGRKFMKKRKETCKPNNSSLNRD